MIYQNATISQLSLKMAMPMSPIFMLPMISLSMSSYFYFNRIHVSYSLSAFLNGKNFSLLSVKSSQFSHFLNNVLRIESDIPKNCIASGQQQVLSTSIQIIECQYGDIHDSSIYSTNNDLRVFHCDFVSCTTSLNGAGIYHTDGYFRTDSTNYRNCKATRNGGGFYHKTGRVRMYRSFFAQNAAYLGVHFFVEDYSNDTFYMDYTFFGTTPSYQNESLANQLFVVISSQYPSKKMNIAPQFSRFNFTLERLEKYVNSEYMTLKISGDSNKFSNKEFFPDTDDLVRVVKSKTFTPSPFFTKTTQFTQSTIFTNSDVFTVSSLFTSSSRFTGSNDFNATKTFTPSGYFSKTSPFTKTQNFTCTMPFTETVKFTMSTAFTQSNTFSASSYFSPSSHFSKSESFTPSITGTPSYSPIPTRTPTVSRKPTATFTFSNPFTSSNYFTNSFSFTPSEVFGLNSRQRSFQGKGTMITLIVFGALLLLLGLIANIILCARMVQAGEIIITQQM